VPIDEEDTKRPMELAAEPYAWQEVARAYVVAANYLIDWYDLSPIAPDASAFEFTHQGAVAPLMVLYGVAVENLLKAIRVAHEGSPVVDGVLSKHFAHHDLVSHADRAKLLPSADETTLLERLTEFIEAGRYPVPKGEKVPNGGKVPKAKKAARHAWTFYYPRDVERVWALLEHLEVELRATGQAKGHAVLPETNLRERHRPPGYLAPSNPVAVP
jgi:hypothetical protein